MSFVFSSLIELAIIGVVVNRMSPIVRAQQEQQQKECSRKRRKAPSRAGILRRTVGLTIRARVQLGVLLPCLGSGQTAVYNNRANSQYDEQSGTYEQKVGTRRDCNWQQRHMPPPTYTDYNQPLITNALPQSAESPRGEPLEHGHACFAVLRSLTMQPNAAGYLSSHNE